MSYSDLLSQLRKKRGVTQTEAADYITRFSGKHCNNKNISSWETGLAMPSIEQFLLLCELYGVYDIQETFRGPKPEYRGLAKLNTLGKNRVDEYILMLSMNPLFAEIETGYDMTAPKKLVRLYDVSVAAGTGSLLDSDSYEELELDGTVPEETDFAVKVSGDSMTPRFVDGQIVFIKEQRRLEFGEIGIFELDGESYIKKLGRGELISLNSRYKPIKIHAYNSFHIFGKVVG